jgi:hypothetical protein
VENLDQLIRENRPDLPIHVSLIWWTASNLSLMKSCSPRLAAKKPPPSHLPCCRRIHAWHIFTRAHALSSRRPWRRCRLAVTPPTQPSLAAADLKSPHASRGRPTAPPPPAGEAGPPRSQRPPSSGTTARHVFLAVDAPIEREVGEVGPPRGRAVHHLPRGRRPRSKRDAGEASSRSPSCYGICLA